MKLSRREFLITGSVLAAAATLPSVYALNKDNIQRRYEDIKAFASEKMQNMDKYALAAIVPSIMIMLLLTHANELLSAFISLLIFPANKIIIGTIRIKMFSKISTEEIVIRRTASKSLFIFS